MAIYIIYIYYIYDIYLYVKNILLVKLVNKIIGEGGQFNSTLPASHSVLIDLVTNKMPVSPGFARFELLK